MSDTIRISLTKNQIEIDKGEGLLRLLLDITNDGILSEEETNQLKTWLAENQTASIPAIAYLSSALGAYADTSNPAYKDKTALLKAIEASLPINDRKLAASQRMQAEKDEKQRQREQKDLEKQLQLEQKAQEKQKNKSVHYADFMVAGAKRKEYSENIELYADIGDPALFERDLQNEHDENATFVLTKGHLEMATCQRQKPDK